MYAHRLDIRQYATYRCGTILETCLPTPPQRVVRNWIADLYRAKLVEYPEPPEDSPEDKAFRRWFMATFLLYLRTRHMTDDKVNGVQRDTGTEDAFREFVEGACAMYIVWQKELIVLCIKEAVTS
jgi:hypothetical protein